MPLTGTNRKCAHCIKECKQFKQITVVACPSWSPKLRKNSICKADEVPEMASMVVSGVEQGKTRINGQVS